MSFLLPVNQIIPFSNVDGEGNRLSIFVQGCQLNCLYCHNSETIQLCNNCGICVTHCESGALSMESGEVKYNCDRCMQCDECINSCPNQSTPKAQLYSMDMLMEQIKIYSPFIRGITVSGGEPTLYAEFLSKLFEEVKKIGLTCYVDANGFFDPNEMESLITIADGFLFDFKTYQKQNVLCGVKDNNNIKNLKYLLERHKIIEVRTVLINDYMDIEETIIAVSDILIEYVDIPYKLIRAHLKGLKKRQKEQLRGVILTEEAMISYKNLAIGKGVTNIYVQM
jgi:pyruvate formate lyase activating enzyme